MDAPKTRTVVDLLRKIGASDKKVLILTSEIKPNLYLSARNLPQVKVLPFHEVSAYDLMAANEVVIEAAALTPATEVAHA